jgi:hypothetical protein
MSQTDDKLLETKDREEGASAPQPAAASPSIRIARMIAVTRCNDESCGCERVFIDMADKDGVVLAHGTIPNVADAYQLAQDIVEAADAARARSAAHKATRRH